MSSTETFGPIRSLLWPVYRSELKKFVPMLFIFFLITFNYNILRAAKDALVVTAPSSGAEALPFIKVWAILPAAFLMTFLFTRVSNRLSKERVFYAMMAIFLVFFFIFTFFLYPFRESLHPNALADELQSLLPIGCKGLIAIFRNWTYTTFYIMSEMWSTMIMTILFWGFANDVTSVNDAKRFYGLLGVACNASGIFAGFAASWLSTNVILNPHIPFGTTAWDQSVLYLNSLIILCGVACMFLFRYLHRQGLGYQSAGPSKDKSAAFKMGLRKNFAYLARSKYLIWMAVIVVTYNIAINLLEVVWKDQVKALYPNPSEFNAYMGQVLTAIGVLATFTSIFLSGNLIRRFSWTSIAMISPVIIVTTGVGFFLFLLLKDTGMAGVAAFFGSTPLAIGVFFGTMQNCFSRASKYTLFDATKELAFVPLSEECKLKGKAAIDGVGSRLGKSGGAIIHQSLLMSFGTMSLSTPYIGVILLFVIGAWMWAVRALGHRFTELTHTHSVIDLSEEDPPPTPVPVN